MTDAFYGLFLGCCVLRAYLLEVPSFWKTDLNAAALGGK